MILESIYEPTFSDYSHGFRPKRSCHTALEQIQRTFAGANWFVEGDIKACFDSFDHHVISDILRRRIDEFASLMHYSMLKTFANKYRTKTRKIKKKYFRDGRFTVIYKTKSGMKESVFYRGPFIRKDKPNVPQADILPAYKRYDRPNRIAAKLRSKTCELCGLFCSC